MLLIEKVTVGKEVYLNVPSDSLLDIGVSESAALLLIDNAKKNLEKNNLVEKIRSKIKSEAGDSSSLLGTTSDATQLLLYGFTSLIAKLNTANSLAEVRDAAAPFAALSTGFLTRLEAGEVKLPFMAKGLDEVVTDIEKRATSVAQVLEENS